MINTSRFGGFVSGISLDLMIQSDAEFNEDQILLVDITENDYGEMFHRKRPLDPATILELVAAAHKGGAKLIAVDISTADWPKDQKLDIPADAAIVWARDFYLEQDQREPHYAAPALLGGNAAAAHACYGFPSLGEEAGVVRWFDSGLEVGSKYEPSFADQIVHRSQTGACLMSGTIGRRIIKFRAKIPVETAGTLLAEGRQKTWGATSTIYKGRIVILGGSFHSGADVHETPVGTLDGLEIVGRSVSCTLRKTAYTELGEWTSTLIDLAIGLLLVLFGLVGSRAQLYATLIACLMAVFLVLCLYRQYYLFLSFLPILAGIFVHRYLEKRLNATT